MINPATTRQERIERERLDREHQAIVARVSGCTGRFAVDGHYHFANGECDNELPYAMGGPA